MQLENEMQRLVAFAKPGQRIPVAALSAAIHSVAAHSHRKNGWRTNGYAAPSHSLKAILEEVERTTLEDVLTRCAGNISQAAAALELSRGGLYAKLERYGIALPLS
jgi:two-component system, NtrC family, response regulator HupR/HoxA